MTCTVDDAIATESSTPTNGEDISVQDFLVLRKLLTAVLEENINGSVPELEELDSTVLGLTDAHYRWLRVLDLCAAPEALRLGVQRRNPHDRALVTLLRYLFRQDRPVDHDRFDWVLTYILKRRLENGTAEVFGNIGTQIMEMFPDFRQPPLSSNACDIIKKMAAALEEIKSFTSFPQLTGSGLIARGRELKEQFQEERFHPAALSAAVNYNLVLGKAFKELFNEGALRSRELAKRLAVADYRSNVEHMNKVVEPAPAEGGPQEVMLSQDHIVRGPLQDPIKELGLDESRESQKLRFATRSLLAFFEDSNHRVENMVRLSNLQLLLAEWETRALSTDYPPEDTSFRAEFARCLAKAVSFLYRIAEESDQLARKSSSEYLWKPHYDALLWLYTRGQEQVAAMQAFAQAVAKRGLAEKESHILKTTARLTETLAKVAANLTTVPGRA